MYGSSRGGWCLVLAATVTALACGGGSSGGDTLCSPGQIRCDGACIDPLTDRQHCGADAACQGGQACGAGQVCGGGHCATSCPPDQVACDGTCVDPLTDRAYCGADAACQGGQACGAGQVCGGGHCAASCPPDQVACNGKCVDPLTDRAYCGADTACAGYTSCGAGEVCGGGHCATSCPPDQVACNGKCVDPLTDRAYCGADTACAGYTSCGAGEVCGGGHCAASCPSDQVACNGKCVDPLTDRAYCGADSTCQGYSPCASGQVCDGGRCATACPAGEYACGGRCIDPDTDAAYCGARADCTGGHACGAGSFCDRGACWSPCDAGQAFCGHACVDAQTNRGLCGASGLCAGAASGYVCAPDRVCAAGACACPEGQTACDDGCRFGACGAPAPGLEWKASVPLTAPPRFRVPGVVPAGAVEPDAVLAHVVFDGAAMVDLTGHTRWLPQGGTPAVSSNGMWSPPQPASGPFGAAHWLGDEDTRTFLQTATAGPFTVCARYRAGAHPDGGPTKVVVALGKPEGAGGTLRPGGWALMQMHRAACFHYYAAQGGEWMAYDDWNVDSATLTSTEWVWQCGGWTGTGPAALANSSTSTDAMPNGGAGPLLAGFPAELERPAIGAYFDGSNALDDGQVYEIIITSDPATPQNMSNVVARASGGLRYGDRTPLPVIGADGRLHAAAPSTVKVEADGAVIADQDVLLGAVLTGGGELAASGQCWGIDASAEDWSALDTLSPVLRWRSADTRRTSDLIVGNTDFCVNAADDSVRAYACASTGFAPGSRHRLQGCLGADGVFRTYVDGRSGGTASSAIPDESFVPHPDDASSTVSLMAASAGLRLWRVWACAGDDPADCP